MGRKALLTLMLLGAAASISLGDGPIVTFEQGIWKVTCGVDTLTDRRDCALSGMVEPPTTEDNATVIVTTTMDNPFAAQMNVYGPRLTDAAYRVDKNPAHHALACSNSICLFNQPEVIQEMKRGRTMLIRLKDHNGSRDRIISLAGFSAAYAAFEKSK